MKKVYTNLNQDDYNKLILIQKKYNFKSIYEIFQCLVQVFISRCDLSPDEPLSIADEVSNMFEKMQNVEAPKYEKKYIRKESKSLNNE